MCKCYLSTMYLTMSVYCSVFEFLMHMKVVVVVPKFTLGSKLCANSDMLNKQEILCTVRSMYLYKMVAQKRSENMSVRTK